MAKYKRTGRKNDETRPIVAKAGVIKKAVGSGYFKIGDTEAYAAVYGPRELHPKFLQNPRTGVLRCNYNMIPFSTWERVRPGPSRRSKEISMVTEKALSPVVDLSDYPNTVVDVFIEVTQADAGTRCAGICAASIALADAGIRMKDMVAAVAAGKVGETALVDLDYIEENPETGEHATDVPIAMVPSTGEITLLQMDGFMSRKDLKEIFTLVKPAMETIRDAQRKALKERYVGGTK